MWRIFLVLLLALAPVCLSHGQSWAANNGESGIRVALVLEHVESSPWNDLLISGLEKAKNEFGMRAHVVHAPQDSDQTAIFREAAANSDLVIVASDNMHEILRNNAANFRRVKFGAIDAGIRAPNIMSVTFADEQAAYLAGVAAAMQAAADKGSHAVGWLSGADTPAMRSLFNGFSEGAKLGQPDTRVIQAICDSFTSPDIAARKAQWLLDNGARIVALAAGAGNPSAGAVLDGSGIRHISLDRKDGSQNENGAIVKAIDRAVYEIAASAASGAFRGKEIVVYNLANGGVNFIFTPAAGDKNSGDIERRLKELRHELETGSIHLRSQRARTLCDCLD